MAGFRGKLDRYLSLKGVTYWFKMGLPKNVQKHFDGKTAFLQSLKTSDKKVARDRRDALEREIKDIIRECRDGTREVPKVELALNRGILARQSKQGVDDPDELFLINTLAEEEEERFRSTEEREAFARGWLGRDPVDKHVDKWLEAADLAEKTTKEWAGLVRRFARWCGPKGYHLPNDITRKVAGQYVTDELEPMNRKTARKHLSAIGGYWEYLSNKGLVDTELSGNPWRNQLLPQRRKQGDRKRQEEQERAFTDGELQKVLYIDATTKQGRLLKHDAQMKELALIGALSGMRLGEIVTMTVGGVKDGLFDLSRAKTEAGIRTFPIHSKLKAIIDSRSIGKGDSELLFHEMRHMKDAPDTMSKAFTRRRKALGVTEIRDGKRRSLVNFHSFRRTFVTKARHANFSEADIANIVGHDTEANKTMTFGTYNREGSSMEQRRAVIEAVQVPAP